MNRRSALFAFSLYSLLATACRPEVGPEADAAAWGALVTENALAPNALAPNSLVPNALAPNALAPNALAPNALAPNSLAPTALTALQDATVVGDLARQLLRYTVGCALAPTQSFSFSWIDAAGVVRDETYAGELGIAPDWAAAPLTDVTRQRLVSACLAARVNWYGVSVVISVRSVRQPLRTIVTDEELADYPDIEGAFWGNVFSDTPYLNACYHPGNEAIARAALRDCAVGHVEDGQTVPCGIIALRGPCSEACPGFSAGGEYYPLCKDHPEDPDSLPTATVITTALP